MDPPDGITTNISCLGNVATIAWRAYTQETDNDFSDKDLSPNSLYVADLAIRLKGGYSHLDSRSNRLWIFDLPKEWSNKDSSYHGIENSVELTKFHGLQEADRGTLLSQGFASPADSSSYADVNVHGKRERSDDTKGIMKMNALAASKNQLLEPSPDHTLEAAKVLKIHDFIRTFLLRAVQSACISALTRSQHYIQLGIGLFCSTNYTGRICGPAPSIRQAYDVSIGSPLWSLKVVWSTNGSFLLSYNQIPHKEIVWTPRNAELDIVLAPMGWTARTMPPSRHDTIEGEPSTHRLGSGPLWQAQCLQLIRQHGLQIEDNLEWIMVEVNTETKGGVLHVIEWPHRFCFAISRCADLVRKASRLPAKDDKIWRDPLQEAAEWVNDTKNREVLIKEQLLARQGNENTRYIKNPMEEEVLAYLQSKHEESLDAQAIAGIYPTPPDVNKNHGHTHIEPHPSLLAQSEEPRPRSIRDGRIARNPAPALDASVRIASYDPLKDDDLFADMDGGMDGDNGVTEDDFRFFDEPEESELLIEEPDSIEYLVQEPSLLESPREIDADDLQSVEATQNVQDGTTGVEDAVETEDIALQADDSSIEIQNTSVQLPVLIDLMEEPIAVTVPQTLDSKYSATGKYAWTETQRPSTATPHTRIEQNRGIPLIRNNLLSISSSISTPSSEPSQQFALSQENSNSDTDQMDLFLKQIDLLGQFIVGCDIFKTSNEPRGHPKGHHSTFTSMLSGMSEYQIHGLIQLAQIIADQSLFYDFLEHTYDTRSESMAIPQTASLITSILQHRFPHNQAFSLQQCTQLGTSLNLTVTRGTSFVGLLPTTVRVKRADSTLELSNTALDFWKELSIKPLHGPKDVTAICLCEDGEAYRVGSTLFLQSMEDTYRSLNLGSHSAGHPTLKSYPGGVISVPGLHAHSTKTRTSDGFCNQLGKSLSALIATKTTIVVYIVKSSNGVSLTSLCILFQKVFEAYAAMFRKTDQPSDLVLQLIPAEMIASGAQHIFLNLKHHVTMSKIVYNRCPIVKPATSPYASASMVQLAEPLPASIGFKLSSENSVHASGSTETLHLAYSYREKSHWLSACMTDAFGSKQWNASYYLGDYSDPKFALTAIAHEIWEIVRLAADYQKIYNILIAKTTKWSMLEMEIWKNLAHGAKTPLTLVMYDTSCPITLEEVNVRLPIDSLEVELGAVPPTPDVSSPDPAGTKGEEQDSTFRLIDAKTQAWWMATNYIMAAEGDSLVIRQHLASGYLIYRDAPMVGLYVEASTHAVDMMAIVEAYHGLRALARARCVHKHLPWHIAVAEGAQSGLERHIDQYNPAD